MRFSVLGTMRAGDGLNLGGPKQQLVLARLLCEPNRPVPTDTLVQGLWGDDPPGSARHTVQSYVSELRMLVGDVIQPEGRGYRVHVDATSLDSLEFEALISEGHSLRGTDAEAASTILRRALDLWRGTPFLGLDDHGLLDAERRRLDELRLTAFESRIDADLALGRHNDLIGELDTLTEENPYREELRAQHMVALYRSGRQAEALRAYQRTRAVLGDDLGIDPSPRLRRLEEQMLVQDPDLLLATPEPADLDPTGPVYNPYKGLRAFTEADAEDFFGRDVLVGQLMAAVAGGVPLLALVGPSGSGKSSVMRAGLTPVLRTEEGSLPFRFVATMTPGAHPYEELETALLRAFPDPPATLVDRLTDSETGLLRTARRLLRTDSQRLVLMIDQFEELFTLVDEDVRSRFIGGLVVAAEDPQGQVQIVITLRADFYDRPLSYPGLARLMTGNVVNVTPLDPDSLETAAVGPASRMGVGFGPGLLAELVSDVAGQSNALPLFQYALTELFDRRADSQLTLAAYRDLGGLRRAVAAGAEETFQRLDSEQQAAALQLFLRLVTVGEDTETRRRVPASELLSLEVDVVAMQAAVEAFVRARLVTIDRDPFSEAPVVEVAHEALLSEWERLSGWIEEHRSLLRRYPAFAASVDEWLTSDRDPDYLLTGGRLDDYARWRTDVPLLLTAPEREYLDEADEQRRLVEATEAALLAGERRRLRRARRTNIALVSLVTLALVLVVSGVVIFGSDDVLGPSIAAMNVAGDEDDQIGELASQGLTRAEQDFGVTIQRLDVLTSPAELIGGLNADLVFVDPQSFLELTIDGTYDQFKPGVHYVAESHGTFTGDLPNLTTVTWADEEAGFLAGVAAASTTSTGTIGYLGATFFQDAFRAGYEAGAHWIDPEVKVLASQIQDFDQGFPYNNIEAGRTIAELLYQDGADVIFAAAGRSGFGLFEAATEASADDAWRWAIGVDTDQWQTATEAQRPHILTSALKRVDRSHYEVIAEFLDGTLQGGLRRNTVADEMIGFSRSGNVLESDAIEALERAETALRAGEIDVPITPVGELTGPKPDFALTVTLDGRSCSVAGPSHITQYEAVRIVFENRTTSPGSLVMVDRSPTAAYFIEIRTGAESEASRSIRIQPGGFELSAGVIDPSQGTQRAPIHCGNITVG